MTIRAISVPYPGVSRVLEEGQKLGMWEFIVLDGEGIPIHPADMFIFGAWNPFYERIISVLKGKIVILWTSSIGEVGFEPVEIPYLRQIVNDPRIHHIWFNNQAAASLIDKGFYAPYPLDTRVDKLSVPKTEIITLFCPPTIKKNIMNQLAAIALVQRSLPLTLHTNVPIDPLVAEILKLRYVQYEWLERPELEKLVASARVNMAASWAETFNYGAAEAILRGTTTICSHTIPWATFSRQPNISDPNSINEIAFAISYAAQRPTNEEQHSDLLAFATKSNPQLEKALTSLL